MTRPSREELTDSKDHFFAVKVKHVAEFKHEEVYAEYSYRISPFVSDLPSADDDLGFQGFSKSVETPTGTTYRSYVCTELMSIDKGSRTHKKLKKNLAKEPWMRTAGGV